jgi:hypothetical protein
VDAGLWDGLAAQVTGHGYTLQRGPCPGEANGVTDPAGRTVRVRADVDPRQAVKTLAHELAHIQCGHTAAGSTYLDCRGRAEIEAESTAYVVLAASGVDTAAYTVPYLSPARRSPNSSPDTLAGAPSRYRIHCGHGRRRGTGAHATAYAESPTDAMGVLPTAEARRWGTI